MDRCDQPCLRTLFESAPGLAGEILQGVRIGLQDAVALAYLEVGRLQESVASTMETTPVIG